MTPDSILQREFEKIKQDLIAKHDELGMRASGNWANELEVKVTASENKYVAQIIGEQYTQQLVNGRKSGTMPPVQALEKWIQDKGVFAVQSQAEISGLAYAIATKIKREGTEYFKQGGTELLDSVITAERIQSIIDLVGDLYAPEIFKGIREQFKRAA